MEGTITVGDLKKMETPASPRKSSRDLVCAVASKSPLKDISTGRMFSMTISDEDPTCNVRAVSFNENLFNSLEVFKTYCLKSFKIKKGYGHRSSDIEVLLDNGSTVETSPKQFAVNPQLFDIATILRLNGNDSRAVNTKGKVTRIEEASLVGSPPDTKMKRVVYLTDATGSLSVVFWREQASALNFSEGDVVHVENLRLSNWNGQISGNVSLETSFRKTGEEMEVTQAVLPKQSNIVSTMSCVEAIKDFSVGCKCRNCNSTQAVNVNVKVITCKNCKATFLKDAGKKDVRCMVLLSEPRQQWYSANTQVNKNGKLLFIFY